ncbi:MAG TPA: trypsin-like peptidase domain-containing protein [Usitatibacter sp.]|nr:trypsin-like peptidase domain-containing protein [Usitatibacter sp.]
MAQKKSLYDILGVPPDANEIDIGLAYEGRLQERQRSARHDPNEEALVQQAFEILSNPKRRAAYDASRVTAAEREAAAKQTQAPDLVVEDDGTETPARPKWLIPAIVAGIAVLAVAFFAMRSGPPAVKAPPPAVVESPKPPPPAQPLRAEQILPAAIRATGQLLSYDMSGAAVPLGIAVSLEAGTVITTCHGIAAGSKLVFRQGTETHSAELLVIDEVLDLCKLTVPGLTAAPLAIATEEPKAGDKIFALGMNSQRAFALTEGTVRKALMSQNAKLLDLSVPIAPTSSGGPVVDAFGRVVGIATTPHRHGSDVNAAISSAWISQMRSRARPL